MSFFPQQWSFTYNLFILFRVNVAHVPCRVSSHDLVLCPKVKILAIQRILWDLTSWSALLDCFLWKSKCGPTAGPSPKLCQHIHNLSYSQPESSSQWKTIPLLWKVRPYVVVEEYDSYFIQSALCEFRTCKKMSRYFLGLTTCKWQCELVRAGIIYSVQ